MIPILKLMLALATVLGVVLITINSIPPKRQKHGNRICDGNFVKDQLQNASQKALDAIGSKRKLSASQNRAKRGQHVFNNGLLGFHRSVLQDLLKDVGGYDEQLKNLEQDLMIPLSQTQRDAISTTMVARFRPGEFYVDFNADVFGEYMRELRKALVAYLKAATSDNEDDRYRLQVKRQQVQFIANQMVNHNVYVDPMACDHWLKEDPQHSVQQYNEVRDALMNMFQKKILQAFKNVSKKIRGFRERKNWNSSDLK